MLVVVYFLVGISSSGKSTWASKQGVPVVSSDAIREELFGDANVQADPGKVFSVAHNRVIDYVTSGKDVIFDATNVTSWSRKALLDKLPENCRKVAVVFNVTPREALKMQEGRQRKVPAEVIRKQWDNLCTDFDNIVTEFDEIIDVQP